MEIRLVFGRSSTFRAPSISCTAVASSFLGSPVLQEAGNQDCQPDRLVVFCSPQIVTTASSKSGLLVSTISEFNSVSVGPTGACGIALDASGGTRGAWRSRLTRILGLAC